MDLEEEFSILFKIIKELRKVIVGSKKHKYNKFYLDKEKEKILELNSFYKKLKARLQKIDKKSLKEKFKKIDKDVNDLINLKDRDKKLEIINELEFFWPEIEVEFEDLKVTIRIFDIPKEIPMTDSRLDLEEAIKDFDNGCFLSAIVLCRRSFEGALVEIYKIKTGKEPIEDFKCEKCGYIIKKDSYMGIAKLHKWAIKNKIINEKFKSIGFLLTDIGSGGAHPLKDFSRDPEIARVSITTTIALLKEIYKK